MTIEKAIVTAVDKPWGSLDLRPWSDVRHGDAAIGELWFLRPEGMSMRSDLLFKLIFANQRLSIQVHPDDAFARSRGLRSGKTEAWYVVSAAPGAQVAIGLKHRITAAELRASIESGSIADLVEWRDTKDGGVVFVPAGTIHAIGAGLVIAEIQQRSDTTYRLYDFGRHRDLDIEDAISVAFLGPAAPLVAHRVDDELKTQLIACPQFELELIDVPSTGVLELQANMETWILVLEGCLNIDQISASPGEVIFLESENARLTAGSSGFKALCARVGGDRLKSSDGKAEIFHLAPAAFIPNGVDPLANYKPLSIPTEAS